MAQIKRNLQPDRHSLGRLSAYFAGKTVQNEEKSRHDLTCEVAGTCGLRKNHSKKGDRGAVVRLLNYAMAN